MAAGAEGQVGARGALGDEPVAVVDLVVFGVNGGGEIVAGAEGGAWVPPVGFPQVGVGEVRGGFGCDAWGGEEGMGGGDGEVGVRDGDGGFDFAEDGVDGGVDA